MAYQNNKNNKNTKNNTQNTTRWTDITGSAMIFGEEKESRKGSFMAYSTSIGRKDEKGWENLYARVRFPKDDDPGIEGGFKVNILSGFLSFDTWIDKRKNIHKELALVITAWELITD